MTSFLLDTLVNLDFALHVAINIKTIGLSLYYKPHTTAITDKLFLLFLNNLENIFFFPFKNRINLLFKAVKKTIYSILNESYYKRKKDWKS